MSHIHLLSKENSVATQWINELRNEKIQTDRLRFRRNLERLGELGALEISKTLDYNPVEIQTPLSVHSSFQLTQQPVILTILRAGIPMFNGVLNYFDHADSGFIGAYRKHNDDKNFTIRQEYVTCPEIANRPLIITDPMLATGASLIEALTETLKTGTPSSLHVLCAIAAEEGLEKVNSAFPKVHIWCGTIDKTLNQHGYIVPGLGDAGDLSFGSKLQD